MQFNPDEQLVGIGGAGTADMQKAPSDNSEDFGLRIVSLAEFLFEQGKSISLSANPVDEIVFGVFVNNLKLCCDGEISDELVSLHPILENFSVAQLHIFSRFLANIHDFSCLDLLVKEIDEDLALAPELVSITDKVVSSLPESFLSELSNITVGQGSQEVFQKGADSLRETTKLLYISVRLSNGKRAEKLLLNLEEAQPDYGLSCSYIEDLLNIIKSAKNDGELFECFNEIFLDQSVNLIIEKLRPDQFRDFLLYFLEDILKMFQFSRIMFSYNNMGNLAFLQDILKNSKDFFLSLLDKIQEFYQSQEQYAKYSKYTLEELEEEYLKLSKHKFENQKTLNLIYCLKFNIEELNVFTHKFLSADSGFLEFDDNDRTLLEFLCFSGVSALRRNIVLVANDKFCCEKDLMQRFFSEALFKLTMRAHKNLNNTDYLENSANQDYCSELFRHVQRGLFAKKYIENPSSLIWVNSSDSPLDFLQSTDSFFLITEGNLKDVVIRYDITTNSYKRVSRNWGSVILRTQAGSQKQIFNDFDLFRADVFKYLDIVKKAQIYNSPHYFKGLSDFVKSL